jgi:hypothetical protein
MSKSGLDFHLYKVQFREEATLFPSSDGLGDAATFLNDVLRWTMEQKPKAPRRWVVADLMLDSSIESTIFFGQLVRLKKTQTIHFEEQSLRLGKELIDDADTLAFVMDGKNEYFLLQSSAQILDETALRKFRELFDKAAPYVRKSRKIEFESINPNEDAIEQLKKCKIRKFVARLRNPNGEINRAYEKLLKPAAENTNADVIALTWQSEAGNLNSAEGSAIDEAITLAIEYGSWKAYPYEKGMSPIESEQAPLANNVARD